MTTTAIDASARYLFRERLLVDLPHGTVACDHPVSFGGDGRGPSSAEFLALAVASSVVLTAGDLAHSAALGAASVTSRVRFQIGTERIDDPVGWSVFMACLHQRLELGGDLDPGTVEQLAAAAAACRVLRSIDAGIELASDVEVTPGSGTRKVDHHVNPVMVAGQPARLARPIGAIDVSPMEPGWRVSAAYLPPELGVAYVAGHTYVVGRSGDALALSPVELLVGALCCCSVVNVHHQAGLAGIPVSAISARSLADLDGDGLLRRVHTTVTVTGDLTGAEVAAVRRMAADNMVARTLQQGLETRHEVAVAAATGEGPLDVLWTSS